MPIYAYRCDACGHSLEKLQKISDPPLTDCPACGKAALVKQVTAAGFQLKGTGWYVTDFRSGNSGAAAKADGKNDGESKSEAKPESADAKVAAPAASAETKSNDSASSVSPAPTVSTQNAA